MPENEILTEIRRTREAIARENGCDVAKLFAHFREVTTKLKEEGWNVVGTITEPSAVVREEPPKQ
ncbi:MAG: hypothetical protein K8R23_04385 [Chthoniobacter sp.]|nr:hypothetical protein [Chthoniobacter sp.]